MLALLAAVSALGASTTGLQRSTARDLGRHLSDHWYEGPNGCDECKAEVEDDCKYRMYDEDCKERNSTCTDMCDFEDTMKTDELDYLPEKEGDGKKPWEHQSCYGDEGVILYNRLITPVEYMPHSSLQHVPCPSGYVGSVALICVHGRVSIAADGCRPQDGDMCSSMANACGKMSKEYEEVFFAALSEEKECKDEKRKQKCDLVKERNLCDKENWSGVCMETCGHCTHSGM
jgi:hypothetical protein